MSEPIEIEASEQKPGMTGCFIIKEPTGPRGVPEPSDYRPEPRPDLYVLQQQIQELQQKLVTLAQSGQTS